jgi:catechol 2,3-dioxygenase-like lactoylglutathione lyase family enzyme
VIDHFGINCADFAKASAFYDEVLGVLGYSRQMDFGVAIYFGAFVGDPDGNNVEAVCHSVSAGGAAAGAREG